MKKILKTGLSLFFILFASQVYSVENVEPKISDEKTVENAEPKNAGEKLVVDAELNNASEKQEQVTLYIGDVKVIPANSPTRVVINNPEIIDIISVSKDVILVTAKGQGITNIIWWDNGGQHTSQIQVFLERMELINKRVEAILKDLNLVNIYTQPADSEGKVLLLGVVKTIEDLERVDTALGLLKAKTTNLIQIQEERTSIEIDAMILEIKKDGSKRLGIDLPNGASLTEPANRSWGTLAGIPDALFRISDWTRARFTATVDFLVQEGNARILSKPRLVCQSGKEAELFVGGEKPVLTTSVASTTSSSTQVEYKEYGIKLKIKPKLSEDGKILLNLDVSVSDLAGEVTIGAVDAPTARAYPITKRSTITQVYLNDGQTIAISGLINQKTEEDLKKFPWLSDIPILGIFFRHRATSSGGGRGEFGDSELVITLTPTVMKNFLGKEASKIAEMIAAPVDSDKVKKAANDIKNAGVSFEQSAVINEYINTVATRVQNNIVYPWAAKQGGIQGIVKLEMLIDYSGNLMEMNIKESSGLSVLDENAASMAKKLSPYPPFPTELTQDTLRIEIPVVYKLKK